MDQATRRSIGRIAVAPSGVQKEEEAEVIRGFRKFNEKLARVNASSIKSLDDVVALLVKHPVNQPINTAEFYEPKPLIPITGSSSPLPKIKPRVPSIDEVRGYLKDIEDKIKRLEQEEQAGSINYIVTPNGIMATVSGYSGPGLAPAS